MNKEQQARLAAAGLFRVQFDVPMSEHCTLRAGGKAAALIEVSSLEELRTLLCFLREERINFLLIGRGSNILVADGGYAGAAIRLRGDFSQIVVLERSNEATVINAGAGCVLAKLISWCGKEGLAGLEFLVGIPGSVGGAVRMNAGAWGSEIGSQLLAVEMVDRCGTVCRIPAENLRLSYRSLSLAEGDISSLVIISAIFRLTADCEENIRARCRGYLERRRGKQPAGAASAGSFFKNPPGDFAGRLIEAAGLKGAKCGAAMVSPVHANFFVNAGGATATDILALMKQVQATVFSRFGVRLEPEVRIIGHEE